MRLNWIVVVVVPVVPFYCFFAFLIVGTCRLCVKLFKIRRVLLIDHISVEIL